MPFHAKTTPCTLLGHAFFPACSKNTYWIWIILYSGCLWYWFTVYKDLLDFDQYFLKVLFGDVKIDHCAHELIQWSFNNIGWTKFKYFFHIFLWCSSMNGQVFWRWPPSQGTNKGLRNLKTASTQRNDSLFICKEHNAFILMQHVGNYILTKVISKLLKIKSIKSCKSPKREAQNFRISTEFWLGK